MRDAGCVAHVDAAVGAGALYVAALVAAHVAATHIAAHIAARLGCIVCGGACVMGGNGGEVTERRGP